MLKVTYNLGQLMRKTRLFLNIAFLGTILQSCSVGDSSESLSLSEESEPASSSDASSQSVDDVSVLSGSTMSSRSSRERNPFSLPASHYTVSIYQSYLIPGKNIYGNPRYDFSMTVEAGQPLYSTVDELHDLLDSCDESYHPNGGAYGVYGFYQDETCQLSISRAFTVNSDMNAYYYCK